MASRQEVGQSQGTLDYTDCQPGPPDGRIPACCTVHKCPCFVVLPSVLAQVALLLAGSISLGFEIQGYSAVSMLVLILLSSLLLEG